MTVGFFKFEFFRKIHENIFSCVLFHVMMIEYTYPYIRGIHVYIDHTFRTSKLKIYYQDLVLYLYKPPVQFPNPVGVRTMHTSHVIQYTRNTRKKDRIGARARLALRASRAMDTQEVCRFF